MHVHVYYKQTIYKEETGVMTEQLSEKQITQLKQLFGLFDKNNDGSITTRELGAVMQSLGLQYTPGQLQDIINQADTDGNGMLDFTEFSTFIARKMQEPDTEDELREAFRMFDRQKTGLISAVELRLVLNKLGEDISAEDAQQMVAEADLDGDGFLNEQEFYRFMSIKS